MAATAGRRRAARGRAQFAEIAGAETTPHTSPHRRENSRSCLMKTPATGIAASAPSARALLPNHEDGCEQHAGSERTHDFGAGPPRNIAAQQAPYQRQSSGSDNHQPQDIQLGRWPKTLAKARKHQSDGDHADRQIDPEDPSPSQTLGDETADGGTDNEVKSGHRADGAQRPRRLFPVETVAETPH